MLRRRDEAWLESSYALLGLFFSHLFGARRDCMHNAHATSSVPRAAGACYIYGMQPSQSPSPYAPPPPAGYGIGNQGGLPVLHVPGPEGARPSAGLRRWHLIGSIAMPLVICTGLALIIAAAVISDGSEPPPALFFGGILAFMLGCFGMVAVGVLRSVWFYQLWRWIPREARRTRTWANMSPEFAAFGFWIPYFNIYWSFAALLATCEGMDTLSAQYTPGAAPAPRGLAVFSGLAQIFLFPIAPFVNHIFFSRIDEMAAQIDAARAQNSAGSAGTFGAPY